MCQFPNRFRIIVNQLESYLDDCDDPVSIPEPVQDYCEPSADHRFSINITGVSIPEPVQDYCELPLFETLAAQGVEIAFFRTYFENH